MERGRINKETIEETDRKAGPEKRFFGMRNSLGNSWGPFTLFAIFTTGSVDIGIKAK